MRWFFALESYGWDKLRSSVRKGITMRRPPLALAGCALCALAFIACSTPAVTPGPSGKSGGSGATTGGGGKPGGGSGGASSGDEGGAGGLVLDLPDASGQAEVSHTECMKQDFSPDRVQPELLLALDRSSSMNASVDPAGVTGMPPTRWTETLAGLDEVLKATEATIPWGLRMFPMPSGCQVGTMLDMPVALNAHTSIMKAANDQGFNRTGDTGTPTNFVMQKAVEDLKARNTTTPKYIVLATDGEPTCPKMNGTPNEKALQLAAAVQAVKDAVTAGYKTFVVGIAIEADLKDALNQLADAGGFPRQGAETRYYPVTGKDDLVKALTTITTDYIASCDFTLKAPAPDPKLVTVSAGDKTIPPDPTNGWSFADDRRTQVRLNGMACDAFKRGTATLKVTFACIFE
jgi:hypothetical protein